MTEKKVAVLAYEWPSEERTAIVQALSPNSEITFQNDPDSLEQDMHKKQFDVIFMHIHPSGNGRQFEILERTRQLTPYTPIIATSAGENDLLADEAWKRGASGVVITPLSGDTIKTIVNLAVKECNGSKELDYLRRTQDITYDFDQVVAESQAFREVLDSLRKYSDTDSTILITGDTGTGKSYLSGTVHFNSPRRKKPFVKINCANIPETLLESELFGHERGAFTGADKQRIGRFEQADGGTIFLDEIGEIPLEIQAKLLRVLEEKSFERVGGNKTIQVNVRLIAATNKNLQHLVNERKFREDLYYRINVLPVHLPALRERPHCVQPLAMALLRKNALSIRKKIIGFSPEAMALIKGYYWPGNIRQLSNAIERAVILEEEEIIGAQSLQIPELFNLESAHSQGTEPLEVREKELIIKALTENFWVQKNAAKCLGISPRALNYKIKKFGITHQNWRKHKKE